MPDATTPEATRPARSVRPDWRVEAEEFPPDVAPEIFLAAARTVYGERSLHMGALAEQLGMSRRTLYRRIPDRDALLGEVFWFFARQAMTDAVTAGEGLEGRERILAIYERFSRGVLGTPVLRRFLDAEPETALRVLTSSREGIVQEGVVTFFEGLLADEQARGMKLSMESSSLAYLLVRVGETFIYADVIAGNEPDPDAAVAAAELLFPKG
jgi:AcrR family transcriptional regulator